MRKGSHLTEENKEKLRRANLGKKASPEMAEMLRTFWIGRKHTESTKEKMRLSALGEKNHFFGKNHTPEACKKMSESRQGPKSPRWRGGIENDPYGPGFTEKLKKKIRARDGFICMVCGKEETTRAHDIHHIDYNKKNHDPSNLVTLCHRCHMITNSNREQWLAYFGKT